MSTPRIQKVTLTIETKEGLEVTLKMEPVDKEGLTPEKVKKGLPAMADTAVLIAQESMKTVE